MQNNDKRNTEVVDLGEGWFRLDHHQAWQVWLKTFTVDGKKVTLYLDDWSVEPISLHAYDLADLVIDEDWSNIHQECIFEHRGDMDITVLQPHLPADAYEEVKAVYQEHINQD